MKPTSANGVKGHIIHTQYGTFMFRVYDANYNFIDYNLHHTDLCVTITDEDAYFYHDSVLDHAPKTLGHTE